LNREHLDRQDAIATLAGMGPAAGPIVCGPAMLNQCGMG